MGHDLTILWIRRSGITDVGIFQNAQENTDMIRTTAALPTMVFLTFKNMVSFQQISDSSLEGVLSPVVNPSAADRLTAPAPLARSPALRRHCRHCRRRRGNWPAPHRSTSQSDRPRSPAPPSRG